MDVQIAMEKTQQDRDGRIKRTEDKTNLHPARIDGASGRGHTPELPMHGQANGGEAYKQGLKAGKIADLKDNPIFSTYEERIAYRAGWMEGMKWKT